MSSAVEQVKAKLGIVEVVSNYLKLEKAGSNLRACCPFHHEKTPSFFVSPIRQSYHCFGCNRGGDIISFVEEIEGLDFLGALKILAEKAGVKLEAYKVSGPDLVKEKLYRLLNEAKNYYVSELRSVPTARRYLTERGLKPETIERFGIGWAPNEWRSVSTYLSSRGHSEVDMESSGLIIKSGRGASGRHYDRFRGRIMFPLVDGSGRVVGFSGRVFPPDADVNTGKYINSPATVVYDKSRFLYGFYQAKVEIRKQDRVILVEGQMDLILSHQAGVANAVAVSGTALTREHLELLGRLTRNIVMAFDGDDAGVKAAARAIEIGLTLGLEIKIAALPKGVDPADLILKEPRAWTSLVDQAKHVIDFLLEVIERRGLDLRNLAHAIKDEVYPYLSKLRHRIDQAHFITKISALTGMSEEVIRADLAELATTSSPVRKSTGEKLTGSPARVDRILEKLAGLWWWKGEEVAPLLESVWESPEVRERELAPLVPRREEIILSAELTYADRPIAELLEEVKVLVNGWRLENLRRSLEEQTRLLSTAERSGEQVEAEKILKTCQELTKQINQFKNNL